MQARHPLVRKIRTTARQLRNISQRVGNTANIKRRKTLEKRLSSLVASLNPLRLASVNAAIALSIGGVIGTATAQEVLQPVRSLDVDNVDAYRQRAEVKAIRAAREDSIRRANVAIWQTQQSMSAKAKAPARAEEPTFTPSTVPHIDPATPAMLPVTNATHAAFGDTLHFGNSGNIAVVELGDVDNDGDLDVLGRRLTINYSNSKPYGETDDHLVLRNNGNGTFSEYEVGGLNSQSVPRFIDFDNDGDLDLIELNQNGTWLAYRNTNMVFTQRDIGTTGIIWLNDLQVRDVDGDGDLDLTYSNGGFGRIYTLANNGSGKFTPSYETIADMQKPVSYHEDLDGDGDIDRVIGGAGNSNDYALFVDLSDTIGVASSSKFGDNFSSKLLRTGDMDGDGDIDVVSLGYDLLTPTTGTISSLKLFENDGSGGFPTSKTLETGLFMGRIAPRLILEDMDGDGDLDIAINSIPEGFGGLSHNEVVLFLNDGEGEFVKQHVPQMGSGANGFAIGDMDGDGDLDIVKGSQSGRPVIHYNEPASPFVSHVAPLTVQKNQTTRIQIAGEYFQHREVRSKFFDDSHALSRSDVDASLIAELEASTLVTESSDARPANNVEFDVSPTSTGTIAVLIDNTIGQEVVLLNVGNGTMAVPDVTPAAYTQTLATNGTIQFDFGTGMDIRGIEDGRIYAQSNFFGILTTSQSFSVSGNTVSLALDREFRPNEKISITITSATAQNGEVLAQPLTFMMRTEPSGGTGFFEQRLFGGQSTRDIAGADFDGDGDIDLACANYNGQSQTILWNDGDGYFTQETLHSASNDGVAVGDIDNDGDVDILFSPEYPGGYSLSLLSEPDDDKFQVLRNAGDGTFTVEYIGLPVNTAIRAPGVDLGDLDGDGDLDAVVARFGESFVMWNDGSGRFDVVGQLDEVANRNTGDVKIADINNDGNMDILFANTVENLSTSLSEIWLNDGSGEFTKIIDDAPSASRIQVADFNNDGWLDVASVSYVGYGYVWLNNGNETFSYHVVGGYGARGLGVGDLDGNGTQDIIQGMGLSNDFVLLNDGSANFALHLTPYSTWSRDMEVADYNGDGKLDVAIPNSSGSAEAILINSSARAHFVSATPCEPTPVAQSTTVTISFSDTMQEASLVGDNIEIWGSRSGLLSAAATLTANPTTTAVVVEFASPPIPGEHLTVQGTSFFSENGTSLPDVFSYQFQVTSTSGNGEFASRIVQATSGVELMETADMNNDGIADVVTYEDGDSIKIYTYDAATGEVSATAFAISNVLSLVLVDKNNDGLMDIIVHRSGNGNHATVYANNGDLTFSTSTFSSGFNKVAGAVAFDYNKDGEIDFYAQSLFTSIYLGQAGTGFNSSVGLSSVFSGQDAAISAMTADPEKFVDLLFVGATQIGVSHGTPSGVRSPTVFAYSSSLDGLLAAATGDADGDGIDEIVYSNKADSTVILWSTTGIPDTPELLSTTGYNDLAVTDVNGDGLADVIGLRANALDVMINTDNQTFAAPVSSSPGGEQLVVLDADNDGDLDIAFVDADDNLHFAFNNPVAPSISSLTPNGTTASVQAANLDLSGFFNWDAEVSMSVLDGSGDEAGTYVPTQAQSTTAALSVTTKPSDFATQGTLTITVSDFVGSTSTTMIVSEQLFGRQDYVVGTGAQLVDVLANDDGLGVVILDAGNPAFGTTTEIDGEIQYIPDNGFYGLENVTYEYGFVGGMSSTGTLSVHVEAPNDGDRQLEQVQMIENGDYGINTLKRSRGAAVSRDGAHVYIGAYTSKAVNHFTRSSTNGTLTYVDNVKSNNQGLSYVTQVALSPDGKQLYTLSRSEYAIGVWDVDQVTGSLTFVERVRRGVDGVDGLKNGEDLAVSPDGRNVYAVSSSDKKLAVFARDLEDGTLTFVERFKDGVDGVNRMNTPRAVTVSPDGKNVYVAAYSDNAITVFSREEETGKLTYVEEARDNKNGVDGLYGASGVSVSPDGSQVVVTGYRDNSVAVFDRSSTGTLSYVECFKHGVDGVNGLAGAYQIRSAHSGQNLFVAGRGANSVAMFDRNPTDGTVAYAEYAKRGVDGVTGMYLIQNVEIDPTSSSLYAMGNYDNSVTVFEISEIPPTKRGAEGQAEQTAETTNSQVLVYPQPANERVTVEFGVAFEMVSCTVLDAAGRQYGSVRSENSRSVQLSTADFPSGVYFLMVNVTDASGTRSYTKELVVVK